tara:strand:+ start:72 stop:641 length:570 start_codon:yes stop_codon:yes gene_type:complete
MLKNTINIFNKILLTSCVLFLSILVIITVMDVFGRYLLDLPLPGASELTEIILAILIYIGLPYICRDEGHVTVSIISNNIKYTLARAHSIIINALVCIILFIIGLQLIAFGINLNSYNDITTFLEIPKAPIAFILAFLTLLASLMSSLNCYYYFTDKRSIKTQSPEDRMYASYKRPGIIESTLINKEKK